MADSEKDFVEDDILEMQPDQYDDYVEEVTPCDISDEFTLFPCASLGEFAHL